MDYRDFTIDVRSRESGSFEATVVESPIRDSPRVFFSDPVAREVLGRLRRASDKPVSAVTLPAAPPLRELGRALYRAVFQDGIAELFTRCRAGLPADGRTGLRIRLRFRLDDEEAEYLAALPWESLCDADDELLATDLGTIVVRDIQSRQPQGVLSVQAPLRILVVGEDPTDLPDLKLSLEMARLKEALAKLLDSGQVELIPLENPSLDALRDFLLDEPVHVLHFIGHGGFHSASGTGALFFVRQYGTKEQVNGERVADYLKGVPDLRLVVLNSCKSARYAGREGAPSNHGVASAILERTRVLAVLANQYTISSDAAADFTGILYGRIAAGFGVDAALAEARMRIRHRSHEWATPVLFLGARDGRLFTMESKKTAGAAAPERPVRSAAQPVRLGIRSIVDWGKDMEERNDQFLDLAPLFEKNRYIRDRELWQSEVLPRVRDFLREHADEDRPLVLDLAAHSSIAFAAGWVLEAKSGLDVRVRQRMMGEGVLDWHPREGEVPEGPLWCDETDLDLDAGAGDLAVALAVSQATVPEEARDYVQRKELPVGRILRAVIAPEPGPRSVLGGAHALRLAQSLLPRIRRRRPQERGGSVHLFSAAPNALVFYLGQLSRSLGRIVLYEYPFQENDSWGRYQRSIELEAPGRDLSDW